MEKAFKSKTVIVTGGNSGIGRELVRQLSGYGAIIYITGRNTETGDSLVSEIQAEGGRAVFLQVDVQKSSEVEACVSTVLEREGQIDYLFHCAGIILGGEIRDHRIEDIQNVVQTNVFGTACFSYYMYRHMAERGTGHIINVASAAGLFPLPLMGVYSASKFGVFGFTEALRMEANGIGVRVSTVAPGIVDTPIYDRGTYSKTDKNRAKGLMKNRASTISADKAARRILKGTVRNQTVISTQFYVRLGWWSYRYFPYIFRFICTQYMKTYRQRLRKSQA